MPTKRRRIDRRRKAHVTDEAVALFVRCEALDPIYHAHLTATGGSTENVPNAVRIWTRDLSSAPARL